MTVKVTKDRLPDLMKSIDALTRQQVLVGIPSTTAGRDDGPITNAVIGYINEFGSPAQNIPARPFLVPGVKQATAKFTPRLESAAKAALDGDRDRVQNNLMAAGTVAAASAQSVITSVIPPPLSERTLEARRARGRTGTVPLIDTGVLRRSITWVIRPRKG